MVGINMSPAATVTDRQTDRELQVITSASEGGFEQNHRCYPARHSVAEIADDNKANFTALRTNDLYFIYLQ